MFDQKPNQPALSNNDSAGNPPFDLPTDDSASNREPEDILSDTDIVEPEIKGPARPASTWKRGEPALPAITPPEKAVSKEPFVTQYKKAIVVVFIVLLVGGVLAVGGWYSYGLLTASPTEPAGPVNVNQSGLLDQNQPLNSNQPAGNQNVNVAAPEAPVDTDRDGLSDEEEAMYGTDINKVDTDQDALTDRDEVKVFKTDPNNPDTDGDTFLDGEEVRAGYDPKGEGRLLKIE